VRCFERAFGYGAAVIEGGLGFLQFFWDRNRMCAQDRLAETIAAFLPHAQYHPDRSKAPRSSRPSTASKEFLKLSGQEFNALGEAHGQFEKSLGLVPYLTLALLPDGPTLRKKDVSLS
jgi:hypothetical protein